MKSTKLAPKKARAEAIAETHRELEEKILSVAEEYHASEKLRTSLCRNRKLFLALKGPKAHPGVKIAEIDLSPE